MQHVVRWTWYHTFSFSCVSSLSDRASDSREPSGKPGGGEVAPLREALRAPGLLKDDDSRGETAARAVAPLGIAEVVALLAPETTEGDRREAPVGGRDVVAVDIMIVQLREFS